MKNEYQSIEELFLELEKIKTEGSGDISLAKALHILCIEINCLKYNLLYLLKEKNEH